eukprot:73669-Pleurochrysis_carterae.AAC.1
MACVAAKSQKAIGDPLATKADRVNSIIERMASSATPFSWCTCGGQVELWTWFDARKSVNS